MVANSVQLIALSFIVLSPLLGTSSSNNNSSSVNGSDVLSSNTTELLAAGDSGSSEEEETPFVNATEVEGISGEIMINEVELNPQGSDFGNEWVEIYNPGDADATTSDLVMNTSKMVIADFPQDATIEPGETFVILLENSSLSNVAEVLTLVNSSTGEIVDATTSLVDSRDDEYTWQRIPDGNDEWEFAEGTEDDLNDPSSSDSEDSSTSTTRSDDSGECLGSAGCVEGIAIRIVDGDTLYVSADGAIYKVDLALVHAPDGDEESFLDATMFTRSLCLGSPVLVDQDDGQMSSDGSVIASVHCASYALIEELLDNGLVALDTEQCTASEFNSTRWAEEYGC